MGAGESGSVPLGKIDERAGVCELISGFVEFGIATGEDWWTNMLEELERLRGGISNIG